MIINNLPSILALAPKGHDGFTVVAAACRASAVGIIDLCSENNGFVLDTCAQITRLTSNPFGIRATANQVLTQPRIDRDPRALAYITLPVGCDDHERFELAVKTALHAERFVFAEVTSRAEVSRAVAAGVNGLIVAGNEAGGRAGAESSFVLMQAALAETKTPVWVRGGIGPNVAAGCIAAGAAGVVIEGALLLARESPLSPQWRERIARWDGSETTVITAGSGASLRVFGFPGSEALVRLREAGTRTAADWEKAVQDHVGWNEGQCPPVGQDAAFAERMARQHVTVGSIVQAFERAITDGIAAARAARPLSESSAFATLNGTRYPILQGPMTRVSDVPQFARAVADGGGLPFLALAMLRGEDVRKLLQEAVEQLGGRPWGVGILGFVPPELRAEQMAVVREFHPPFALIAGGRPDQATELEKAGIATFLHAPSPGLLDQYLRDGARRFILEGRECGGHVGPRSSFVLWEQAVTLVRDAIDRGVPAAGLSLVFAGGNPRCAFRRPGRRGRRPARGGGG